MSTIPATYISSTQFKVSGDREDNFTPGRRVNANCGVDGVKYLTVESSFINGDGDTEVMVREAELTVNLSEVLFGVVGVGPKGGLPVHDHSNDDQGGEIVAFQDHGTRHVDGTDDVPEFNGATATEAGRKGLVPQPAAGDDEKILQGNGEWVKAMRAADMRRYALLYGV